MWNRWLVFGKTIYMKILITLLMVLLLVIFLMEVSNFYILKQYRKSAEEMYQNSLEYYSDSWRERMKSISNSLLSLIGSERGKDFENICLSRDNLSIEVSKIALMDKLSEITYLHENEIRLFVCIPDRDIYFTSSNNIDSYEINRLTEQNIKHYIAQKAIRNNSMWDLFVSSGQYYLIHIYRMDNGYIGAYLRCETILNELVSGKKSAEAAAILGENNEVIITNEGGINDVSTISFTEKLYYTNYQIGLCVSKTQLYSKRSYIVGITTGAVLLGLVIFSISMRVMLKRIFLPLVNLRVGMETFSEGNMDIRLDENVENNEVRILYKTFNHMAEDIKDLKIGIYEAMIEKQRIQSSYLRVQIQPHFYTNILNLIYNFAEVEDYQGIQNLLLYTSRYFRYLLKDKGDFVELAWEIECVENFVNIQKIRYPGMLEIEIKNSITYPIEIPPLLIQTFIENSVKHNITLVPKVLIFVHIRQQEERLLITIEDTGVGFEKNLLAKINMNAELEENGKHIGIVNIKRRLEYLYRGSAKVLVDNTKSGAAIYIEVPVNHEREV